MRENEGISLLKEFRVLDLTNENGLLCGKVLGDLGADVIKVERPGGDPARWKGPFVNDIMGSDRSLFWLFTNLNKRSITLNLESVEGREIFKRLLMKANVVLESSEPGYLDSIGLGYKSLEVLNPSIVLTSITPFGQNGPYSKFKATDITGCALGGMIRIYGELNDIPYRISIPQFFFLGSLHGAAGTVIALYHAEMTGTGQWVDVSCQEAMAKSLMDVPQWWDLAKINVKGTGGVVITNRPEPFGELRVPRIWECKDGHVIFIFGGGAALGMAASTKAMVELANENGMALEIKDYNWREWDATRVSQKEADRLIKPIAEFLKTKTKAELLEEALKRSILLAPIQNIGEVINSEQLKERRFWVNVDHPYLGISIQFPGFPINISSMNYRPKRPAPLIGEHNEEIYIGEIGLSKKELIELKGRGII
jgi:crotonobetainyl-CoA:carnitine CoA-transferase CaiB-like acyl-CoA transferase